MWFEKLVGFKEDRQQIYEMLELDGTYLHSKANGRRFQYGALDLPSLESLRAELDSSSFQGNLKIKEVVADVQQLHQDKPGAVVQVASQFNLLEMVGPHVTPEAGIGIYEHDLTQGPACAIACGAGTIYRNYFVPVGEQIGQSSSHQLNCVEELEAALANENVDLWKMRNGYLLPTEASLAYIKSQIESLAQDAYEQLKGKLKIGVQWDTELTLNAQGNTVTQVFCSALPIRYTTLPVDTWEPFARLILEATYEATFLAALKQYQRSGNTKLFLTLVGGGAFGNPLVWVLDAIQLALEKYANTPLEVSIVSYGKTNPALKRLL